jgi:hypothetical protein
MAGKKGSSKHRKDRLTAYKAENRSQKNRTRKLQAHVKRNPEDAQAISALKKGVVVYRRKKPRNNKTWSPSTKAYAQTLKFLGYNGNLAIAKEKRQDSVKR